MTPRRPVAHLKQLAPEPSGGEVSEALVVGGFAQSTRASRKALQRHQDFMRESHIQFRADPNSSDTFVVEKDHQVAGYIVRVPARWHCWELFDSRRRLVARFRASRAFSWLVLINSQGQETRVVQDFLCGIGRLEWSISKTEKLRWSRIDQTMVYIRSQRVLLPELVKLTTLPKLSTRSNSGFCYEIKWRCPPLIAERLCFNVVICTAFIAMWIWSREPEKVKNAKRSMHTFCMEWFVRSFNAELLPTILAKSQSNFIGTCAESH